VGVGVVEGSCDVYDVYDVGREVKLKSFALRHCVEVE
jgi:hypothetical protein